MPLLFNYLLTLFLIGCLHITGIFIGLFLLMDGVESIRRFGNQVNFNWPDWGLLMIFRAPGFVIHFLPSIALLATLVVLTKLARDNEITIMRASGIPIYRILIPFMLGGLVLASGQIVVQDLIVPRTSQAADQTENYIKNKINQHTNFQNQVWFKAEHQIIHAEQVVPTNQALLDVTIFQFDAQNRLINRLDAQKMEWQNKEQWTLINGISYPQDGSTDPKKFSQLTLTVDIHIDELSKTTPQPEFLTFSELRRQAERLEQEGYDTTTHRVMLHRKLSDPAATLAAVLLAFPFSLRLQRMGGTTRSLLMGLLAGFAMFIVTDITAALGMGGRLPPLLAAWAPVAFFSGIGGFLLLHLANPHRGH
ncbi:MAG: LPS export ABC transporter permease LptG [Magnetococcus sp. DMHC-6]